MSVEHAWVGATTPDSARVVAKVTGSSTRLAVADNDALAGASFLGPQTPTADGIVQFTATGLDAGTEYHWAIEDDLVVDTDWQGRFRTHPPVDSEASFTLAVVADAGAEGSPAVPTVVDRVSDHSAFDHVRQADPLLVLYLGDRHYRDIGTGVYTSAPFDEDDYRAAYDDVLTFNGTLGADARQGRLHREIATAYVWENHDFGAVTGAAVDSDGDLLHKEAAAAVYRERVPHYPLPDTAGIWQSVQIGRVLVVLLDVRYYRSANSAPDDSAKAYLGPAQLAWLDGLLRDTTAEFLVLASPQQWVTRPTESDTWAVYETERAQLLDILTDRGWLDRMCIVSASMHALGIDTGVNAPGGIPTFLFAGIDAVPAPQLHEVYDTGATSVQRGQWGTLEIADSGDEITVTGTGWIEGALWREHTFTVDLTGPEPEPDEPDVDVTPVATARISTRLTWLSCNLASGQVITELPDLAGTEVSRVIGEYTSANLGLPIPAVGGRDLTLAQRAQLAVQSTEPARTMIVPVINDIPMAGFIPLTRDLGTDATVALGCVSLEGYLRHRYVRDHLWEGVDPSVIARGVLADAGDVDGNGQGIGLTIDAPNVGLTAGRYYQATDDETVYGALSELMDAGLIEWTIDVDWASGMAYRVVDKIARVRLRLGLSGQPTAVFQSATFSSQGASDARYTLKAEYGGDRYGNWIVARGTGEGEDQPRSSAEVDQDALDAGAPIWEQRIQPDIYRSPLFTEAQFNEYVQEQLELHAQQELSRIRAGGQALEITARWDSPGARYGIDWQLGDDVLHELKGHAHPGGFDGVKRAIGFALSIQAGTVRPILQEEF